MLALGEDQGIAGVHTDGSTQEGDWNNCESVFSSPRRIKTESSVSVFCLLLLSWGNLVTKESSLKCSNFSMLL